MFFDSHAHITQQGLDVYHNYLSHAYEQKVTKILTVGCHPNDLETNFSIATQHVFPGIDVYCSMGLHPDFFNNPEATQEDITQTIHEIEILFRTLHKTWTNSVIALGECGYDYYWPHHKDAQRQLFELHIALGKEWNLPLIVHTRDAWDDTLSMLKRHPNLKAVIHCFSGDKSIMDELLSFPNITISFSGVVTFPKAQEQYVSCIQSIPSDRFLIETDTPYLAPVPFRGKANEPAYVAYTAAHIAQLRGVAVEEIGNITSENACRFFGISS